MQVGTLVLGEKPGWRWSFGCYQSVSGPWALWGEEAHLVRGRVELLPDGAGACMGIWGINSGPGTGRAYRVKGRELPRRTWSTMLWPSGCPEPALPSDSELSLCWKSYLYVCVCMGGHLFKCLLGEGFQNSCCLTETQFPFPHSSGLLSKKLGAEGESHGWLCAWGWERALDRPLGDGGLWKTVTVGGCLSSDSWGKVLVSPVGAQSVGRSWGGAEALGDLRRGSLGPQKYGPQAGVLGQQYLIWRGMGRDLRDLKEPEGPGGRKACWPILPLWPGSSLLDMGQSGAFRAGAPCWAS